MDKNLLKNILAVVVGFLTVFVLSVGTDVLMSVVGVYPSLTRPDLYTDWMYGLSLAYACAYTVLGGYLTAKLSKTEPMRQVYILAFLGFISSVTGAYANWEMAKGHEWFCIAMVVTGPMFVYLGGWFFLKK